MKEFFKMFFASILAMIVGGVILLFIVIGIIAGLAKSVTDKEAKEVHGDVLMLDMSQKIHEQGASNPLAALNDGSAYQPGLYELVKAISRAKNDAAIKGIYLKLGPTPNGWATLQQLRLALEDFKTSKKFIYAYGEQIPQNTYFVASTADSIYLNPVGSIDLKGFATVLAYFKGTLEKLDLQPEIFYAGKFKSATEPFRADHISDPNRLQIMALQKGLWDQFLSAAAGYMKCETNIVSRLAETGAIQFPEDARKNRMVADLLYWDQVEKRLQAKTGVHGTSGINFVSLEDYAAAQKKESKYSGQQVALLVAEGNIVDGEQNDEHEIASKTLCEQIRKLRNDDKVKAVVLKVNSPGGSALASEVILRELTLLKQKKHLVVSMGDYAASGGYYISSLADSIFALPNTITGSIGVFSMMFNISPLMHNKLGVNFDAVKNGPYADVPSALRPLTAEEGKRMQNSVDTIYNIFKSHVANGRKLTMAQVDEIAQGRVWTGTDAVKNGLVDGLGGVGRAIKSAAALAKMSDYKVVVYPEPVDKLNALLRKVKMNASASEAVKTVAKEELGEQYIWLERLQDYKKLNGKTLMEMPFAMSIN